MAPFTWTRIYCRIDLVHSRDQEYKYPVAASCTPNLVDRARPEQHCNCCKPSTQQHQDGGIGHGRVNMQTKMTSLGIWPFSKDLGGFIFAI